jgi:hypothetical protein
MGLKIGEFFVSLAVDAASGSLSVSQLIGKMGQLEVASVAGVAGFARVGQALLGMAQQAVDAAAGLSSLQDVTGADPKMVQQWENAAQRMNVSSGTIISAIRGVNQMMGAIAERRQGPPMELSGWLGITPQKGVDASGRPVMKSFFDLMHEIAAPGSKYWGYTPQVQQQLLGGAFPGADKDSIFRILNEMRTGKFRPQDVGVLEDRQVSDLKRVRQDEVKVGQQLTGIFDKLLLGGDAFAKILSAISDKLTVLDKWLASKQGQGVLATTGDALSDIVRHGGNPYTLGRDAGHFLAEEFGFKPAAAPRGGTEPIKLDDLQGRLDVQFTGAGGQPLGRSNVFLRQKVSNADVEHATINAGNGGLGQ